MTTEPTLRKRGIAFLYFLHLACIAVLISGYTLGFIQTKSILNEIYITGSRLAVEAILMGSHYCTEKKYCATTYVYIEE